MSHLAFLTTKEKVLILDLVKPAISFEELRNESALLILKITHSNFKVVNEYMLSGLHSLTTLSLSYNAIRTIHTLAFHQVVNLMFLDLKGNELYLINSIIFTACLNLTTIDISNNKLQHIDAFAFVNNTKLQKLFLQQNKLAVLGKNVFPNFAELQILDISKNPFILRHFKDIYVFSKMTNLSILHVVHEEMCCLVHVNTLCVSDVNQQDIFSTCNEIIANLPILLLIYMYAVSNVVLNITAFIWLIKSNSGLRSILACSLVIADVLMALHMFTVIAFHHVTQNDIPYITMMWKNSVWCRTVATVTLISMMMSNVSTMFIALDRFVCVVIRPMEQMGLRDIHIIGAVSVGWVVGLTVPILAAFLSEVDITNSACMLMGGSLSLPFAIVTLTLCGTTFVIIAAAYIIVSQHIMKTAQFERSKGLAQQVYIRLGAVVVSNFIAYFTVTLCAIFHFSHVGISPTLEAGLVFVLIPLNSCLNPVINTLTTSEFKAYMKSLEYYEGSDLLFQRLAEGIYQKRADMRQRVHHGLISVRRYWYK